ncbi:hypothetical protein GCM10027051_23170 [Niabella terrae]
MRLVSTLRILKAWLLVGTLDIIAAMAHFFISTGKSPGIIFQYIASAVLGPSAFEGGKNAILLGLCLHFLVALVFTCIFFALVKIFPVVLQHKFLTALFYGIGMWAVMRFMVLPLTQISLKTIQAGDAAISIGILFFCIGLPLSYIAGPPQSSSNLS